MMEWTMIHSSFMISIPLVFTNSSFTLSVHNCALKRGFVIFSLPLCDKSEREVFLTFPIKNF